MNMNEYTVPLSNTATTLDITDTIGRSEMSDIEAYIGYTDEDIAGIEADFENNTFTRLAGAIGKSGGSDFNSFPTYAGMRRCNLADDGTVNAYYGDAGYVEDGSNGQVMVEIPKFYYKVVPLKLQKNTDYTGAMGYHLLKARYYISSTPKDGFKVHPLFHIGNRVINKAYISAYEGCIYDVSAGAYLQEDEQVADFTAGTGDKLSSIAGVKPCSGLSQQLTRPNIRTICHNRGTGWEMQTIQAVCAINLLFMVEYGNCNWQYTIGMGISSMASSDRPSYVGSTSSLGNATGNATSTKDWQGNTQTASGKVAISYRGIENFFSNLWKFIDGINVYGDGTMGGGQLFICTDAQYIDSKITDNYVSCGFTSANANNYLKYFGYGDKNFDWLFFVSKTGDGANSYQPVGDYCWVNANFNGTGYASMGGVYAYGHSDGGFTTGTNTNINAFAQNIGTRLIYIG